MRAMVIVLYGSICLDKGVMIGGTGGFCLVNDGFGWPQFVVMDTRLNHWIFFRLTFLQPYHFAFHNYLLHGVAFHFIGIIRERK